MTEQDVIDSDVFRAFNHMIDEKADYIERALPWIRGEINRLFEPDSGYKSYISTRTHEEGGTQKDLPVSLPQLKHVRDCIEQILKLEEEIGQLQRFKLQLLNDYDFTKGDNTLQKKIFGSK